MVYLNFQGRFMNVQFYFPKNWSWLSETQSTVNKNASWRKDRIILPLDLVYLFWRCKFSFFKIPFGAPHNNAPNQILKKIQNLLNSSIINKTVDLVHNQKFLAPLTTTLVFFKKLSRSRSRRPHSTRRLSLVLTWQAIKRKWALLGLYTRQAIK